MVHQNYRERFVSFWNEILPEELNRTLNSWAKAPFANYYPTSTEKPTLYDPLSEAHVNYADKSTDNPIRKLQMLLHHTQPNRTDMYQTQSTSSMVNQNQPIDPAAASPENTFILGDNKNVLVKADSTLNVLIVMIIIFLLINIIIIFAYYLRRNYFKKNLQRKLDVLSLDGTTDDDLKRSNKFNDGDESFILDIVRRKNEYVPVKRTHSPINGFLLSRHYSTSTMDTHTKVSDWISHEVNCHSPKMRAKSPSFSMGDTKSFFNNGAPRKLNGIQNGRLAGDGVIGCPLHQQEQQTQPIELMKSKSFDTRDTIICQEVDVRSDLIDSVDLRKSKRHDSDSTIQNSGNHMGGGVDFVLHLDHRPTAAIAAAASGLNKPFSVDEEITSFIEDIDADINVTSRDECDGNIQTHFPLSPEETLQIIQMRNYPKVLPSRYPDNQREYISQSSFKRRSMPSYQHLIQQFGRNVIPPAPPPRTISTLDRKSSMKRSNSDNNGSTVVPTIASLAQRANEPPSPTIEEEPEITNALHVGPLLPGSKENLYSTLKRNQITNLNSCSNGGLNLNNLTVQHDQQLQQINAFDNKENNDSAHSQLNSLQTSNIPNNHLNDEQINAERNNIHIDERDRTESISSAETSSSGAETVKHFKFTK